jgi:hypothetical protein
MSCDNDCEFPSVPTAVPGARGLAGDPGTSGTPGRPAWSLTTASFVMPAVDSTVVVEFEYTDWIVADTFVYGDTAGYFQVVSVVDGYLATLRSVASNQQAAESTVIASGVKFVPSAYSAGDVSLIPDIADRLDVIESTAVFTGDEGNKTVYALALPSPGGYGDGDICFLTGTKRIYQHNGTTWVDRTPIINLASDVTGEITATNVGAGAITTPKIGANQITATHVGTNEIIANAANIKDAIIGSAKIIDLDAAKLTTGSLATINLGMAGRIFNPAYPAVFFRPFVIASNGGQAGYVTGTGTAFGFTLPTALQLVGPGHADAGSKPILNPDATGVVQIMFLARILQDTPDVDYITIFYRKNDTGPFIPVTAVGSNDAGSQVAIGFRGVGFFSGCAATDSFKFYCAPCDGAGDIATSVTCRVELDIVAYNW